MREPWRRLALAAAIVVTMGAGAASAQTVIVRNAPPGSTVELVLNVQNVGAAKVGADGSARITPSSQVPAGKVGTDAHLYLETCDGLRRVLIVERGRPAADPAPDCTRTQVVEWFVLRRVTTLVLDLGGPAATVWVRQGSAPEQWLKAPAELKAPRVSPVPKGFMVFGAAGMGWYANTLGVACGTATECAGQDSRIAYNAGVMYWAGRYFALDATYLRPSSLTANGGSIGYTFNSSLTTDVMTFGLKLGVPVGRARVYGGVGMNYTRALFSTTQTIEDTILVVDEVPITMPGGTQTFDLPTTGWGWQLHGGLEVWATRTFAVYGEVGRVMIKGKTGGGAEGSLDESVTYMLLGLRVRLGG